MRSVSAGCVGDMDKQRPRPVGTHLAFGVVALLLLAVEVVLLLLLSSSLSSPSSSFRPIFRAADSLPTTTNDSPRR